MTPEGSDPTGAGFRPCGAVRLSGNETEMLCLKAARGAGMEWGLAEEAGFAARWLAARGIDGAAALRSHLDASDGRGWEGRRPASADDPRPAGSEALCPIALGALLSDRARVPIGPVGPVAFPALLLPFLVAPARARGRAVVVDWSGGRATVSPAGGIGGAADRLAALTAALLSLGHGAEVGTVARPAPVTSAETLARLDVYAMRTTVPASRRAAGDAGAATDED